ncbi:hypothetical protein B0T09DRAFT_56856 [Sordaria sp. MPI-SDFR-AT-0083]|nr:hypothetical protein B0T09DRAFT_56856 [Sordaria sp. MPI-SDFR-AT-0083]
MIGIIANNIYQHQHQLPNKQPTKSHPSLDCTLVLLSVVTGTTIPRGKVVVIDVVVSQSTTTSTSTTTHPLQSSLVQDRQCRHSCQFSQPNNPLSSSIRWLPSFHTSGCTSGRYLYKLYLPYRTYTSHHIPIAANRRFVVPVAAITPITPTFVISTVSHPIVERVPIRRVRSQQPQHHTLFFLPVLVVEDIRSFVSIPIFDDNILHMSPQSR